MWTKEKQKAYCNQYHKERLKKFPELIFEQKLKTRYGITLIQYQNLVAKQKGQCAICSREAPLCVDHDHNTKRIRGLLCRKCNAGLGMFNDNVNSLAAALEYIR